MHQFGLRLSNQASPEVLDWLMPLVYYDLRRMAQYCLRGENQTSFQASELVHEVYCILARHGQIAWTDREHFFSLAARLMRRLIVDAARERHAIKRGGLWMRVSEENLADIPAGDSSLAEEEMLRLDAALKHLQECDPQKAGIVELLFFDKLGVREAARTMGVSESTVKRRWRLARLWLCREIRSNEAATSLT